jgi:cysteinyl-tRNA synthetase
MTLTLYNTLTRQKESFQPLEAGKVKMYCCGITVYDYCHLGHARTCITWDLVRRYLQWRGYEVQYIQNFTDIDDKILNRAKQEGTTMEAVADRFIRAYHHDMKELQVEPADEYPRATHALDGIKRLVAELEAKEYAYASEGDVYYAVRNFADYGKLSGRKLDDLQAGASGRVETDDPDSQKKKYPFDFALWKAAKPDEPFWDSPWGAGRPGWHIECSAMVRDRLGETIDLHVGGSDLVFPHHENEIAQSEAATGKPLANYWLHNGMVKVGGEKMSKSLGNFTTIRDLLQKFDPMAVRLFVLQGHYRKPLDFTDEALEAATNGWQTLKKGLEFAVPYGKSFGWNIYNRQRGINKMWPMWMTGFQGQLFHFLEPEANQYTKRFKEAVDDDFNFAEGLAILFELAKDLRKAGNLILHQGKKETSSEILWEKWQTLITLAEVLGLLPKSNSFFDILREYDGRFNQYTDAQKEALVQQFKTDSGSSEDNDSDYDKLVNAEAKDNNSENQLTDAEITEIEDLIQQQKEKNLENQLTDAEIAEIEDLIQQRVEARKQKNFAEGDRLRDELKAKGITLIDQADGGTKWHR